MRSLARVVPLVTLDERERKRRVLAMREDLRVLADDGSLSKFAFDLATRELVRSIRRFEPHELWKHYVMIQPDLVRLIRRRIKELPPSCKPRIVREVFDACYSCMDWDTGRVLFTRDELAEEIGCTSANVSRAASALVDMGVLKRETIPLPGVRGRGKVTYFINYDLAWKGDLDRRAEKAGAFGVAQLRLL